MRVLMLYMIGGTYSLKNTLDDNFIQFGCFSWKHSMYFARKMPGLGFELERYILKANTLCTRQRQLHGDISRFYVEQNQGGFFKYIHFTNVILCLKVLESGFWTHFGFFLAGSWLYKRIQKK